MCLQDRTGQKSAFFRCLSIYSSRLAAPATQSFWGISAEERLAQEVRDRRSVDWQATSVRRQKHQCWTGVETLLADSQACSCHEQGALMPLLQRLAAACYGPAIPLRAAAVSCSSGVGEGGHVCEGWPLRLQRWAWMCGPLHQVGAARRLFVGACSLLAGILPPDCAAGTSTAQSPTGSSTAEAGC